MTLFQRNKYFCLQNMILFRRNNIFSKKSEAFRIATIFTF